MPADGRIVEGQAELDESMITGESRPVPKGPGERVVAGTVSTDTAIRVRVEAVGEDTALAGIQRLVAEAQSSRSHAQVLADRFAAVLFYVATGAGIVTFVVWAAMSRLDDAVRNTVTVLVIACPHALGLAIPLVVALRQRLRPGEASSSRTVSPWNECGPSTRCCSTRPALSRRATTSSPASLAQPWTPTKSCSLPRRSRPIQSIPSRARSSPRPDTTAASSQPRTFDRCLVEVSRPP